MMSLTMVQTPSTTSLTSEKSSWPDPAEQLKNTVDVEREFNIDSDNEEVQKNSTWDSVFQAQDENKNSEDGLFPYFHPTMKRSPSMLSQKSLDVCTENLGSETGSDDFLSSFCGGLMDIDASIDIKAEKKEVLLENMGNFQGLAGYFEEEQSKGNELKLVNYHSSISRRSPVRSFPPPLPSITRRDGPCLQMRPHRRDGRLVVEAVPVPSQNYLHAQREGGRLLLSFVDATYNDDEFVEEAKDDELDSMEDMEMNGLEKDGDEDEEEDDDDDEAAVEVKNRGTVVAEKRSTQTQAVHCSALAIDKFFSKNSPNYEEGKGLGGVEMKLKDNNIGVLSQALMAAETDNYNTDKNCSSTEMVKLSGGSVKVENKLLVKSKRQNRKESMNNMRRCTQPRRPLFICRPCSIATLS